jgi:ribosomal protein L37AE/L43A
MTKIKYDEYNDEMNPFHPCLNCGHTGFSMDWDTGLYTCDSCGLTLEAEQQKKEKKTIRRFRNLKDEDEVY